MHIFALLIAQAPARHCVRELVHYYGTLGHYGYVRRVLICPVQLVHHFVLFG